MVVGGSSRHIIINIDKKSSADSITTTKLRLVSRRRVKPKAKEKGKGAIMEIDNGHNDDRGVDDDGIVHDDPNNDREEAEDDDDEEEITGVARCCSATADFYQLQPSASSLVDDMNTMTMMMTPSSSSSSTTANINLPQNTISSSHHSEKRNNASTANPQRKAFCNVGLHHPEGSKLLRRDPGGFLRAPALSTSEKGSVTTAATGTARSGNPTLGILHQAHSIIRVGKDQSSTALNGYWNNNSPRRYRTSTLSRGAGTEQQDEMSTTMRMRSSIKQPLKDPTKLGGEEVDPPVALAPRFSEPQSHGHDGDHPQELFDWHRQYSFLSSRSASHEATDLQYTHPHPQGQQGRSPTSTTANQIFLRRSMSNTNPCPSLPIEDDEDDKYNGEEDQDMEGETDQLKGSPLIPPIPTENGGLSIIPPATFSRQTSSDTPLRPRAKPVLCRSLAWSQDSQDDRRITKRARTSSGAGMSMLFHPPPSLTFADATAGGGSDDEHGNLSKQLGSNVVNRAIDAANKLSAFGSDVPSSTHERTSNFDLEESWASNSSTSGVAQLTAGFGTGRVRRAYGQPIFASTMENNPFSAPQGTQMFTTSSPSQPSRQQSQHHESPNLHTLARKAEDDSSTMILGTKEHREEPSPIHWCQKVTEEHDLVTHVHKMNNANGISSPASMCTAQIVSSHGQCLSQLQQPMLNHGSRLLDAHPQGPTSLPGLQGTQSSNQCNFEQQAYNQQMHQRASPPVVTAARSSSHYSFDSV